MIKHLKQFHIIISKSNESKSYVKNTKSTQFFQPIRISTSIGPSNIIITPFVIVANESHVLHSQNIATCFSNSLKEKENINHTTTYNSTNTK